MIPARSHIPGTVQLGTVPGDVTYVGNTVMHGLLYVTVNLTSDTKTYTSMYVDPWYNGIASES